MIKTLNFQQIMMKLSEYWADHGALIWQPWHESVGAGTAFNPQIPVILDGNYYHDDVDGAVVGKEIN